MQATRRNPSARSPLTHPEKGTVRPPVPLDSPELALSGTYGSQAVLGQALVLRPQRRIVLAQHVAPARHAVVQLRGGDRHAQRRRQRPCEPLYQGHLCGRARVSNPERAWGRVGPYPTLMPPCEPWHQGHLCGRARVSNPEWAWAIMVSR